MNSINNNINSSKDNPNRRIELLQIARKTRIRWVFEGKDPKDILNNSSNTDSVNINDNNTQETSIINRNSSKVPIQLSDEIKYHIPASECIQNVINFLNEMVDDDEIYDMTTLISDSLECDDDVLEDIISSNDIDNNLVHDNNSIKTTIINNSNSLYAIQYPYLYNQFVSKLILPQAIDTTKSIQQFVFKFFKEYDQSKTKLNLTIEQSLFEITTNDDDDHTNNPNNFTNSITIADIDEEYLNWSNQIWLFLDHIYGQMQGCIIWNNETIEDFEKTKIYCEKFLFKKLHSLLYAADGNDDMMHEKTKERIHSLSFLTAEHLDIKCLKLLYQQYYYRKHYNILTTSNQSNIDLSVIEYTEDIEFLQQLLDIPIKYLLDMNSYYCPQDKLQCIRNCTKAIAQILKDSRSNTSLPGIFLLSYHILVRYYYCHT